MENTKELNPITVESDSPVTIIENHITIKTHDSEDFSTNTEENNKIETNLPQTDIQKEQFETHNNEALGNLNKEIVIQKFQQETTDYRANMTDINALPTNEIQIQNKDLLTVNSAKEQAITTTLTWTSSELLGTKQEAIELTVAQIKTQIHDLKKQVRFAARWEGKDVREVKRYIIDWLNLAEKRVNKYKRATKRFGTEVVKDSHEAAMYAKIATLLSNSKDYVSQAITWDINEAKKFFPPNVFEDGNAYIPDKPPSKEIYNKQIHPEWVNQLSPAERKAYLQCVEWSGSKNSINKELSKVIDTKMGPWLDEHVTNGKGTRVITGAAKLGLLVVNWVTLWNMGKNLFGMVFGKEWKTRGQLFGNFLLNAGIFTGLNFVDPDKAKAALGDTRAWVSGKETGNSGLGFDKDGKPNLSSALFAINNKDTNPQEKIQVHGTAIAGYGLVGLNYGEAAQNNIFQTNGNSITGVNTDNLKELYKQKYSSKPELRQEYINYANNLEQLQQSDPQLFGAIMKNRAITVQDLSNPEYSNIIIGSHISEKLRDAKIITDGVIGFNALDNAVKISVPNIVNEIGETHYTKLIGEMHKLPESIKKDIADKKVEFRVVEWKLALQAHGEQALLDLDKTTISLANKDGQFVEFPDGAKDLSELISLAYVMTREIQENKGKFMLPDPLFYQPKMAGMYGHKIYATVGWRKLDEPASWINGKSVVILDGLWIGGDNGLKKFRDDNMLERFTKYLNQLNIRQGASAQEFIDTDLRNRIAQQYPNLSPEEQDKVRRSYLWLYNTRGNIGANFYNGAIWAKDKVVDIAGDVYQTTKEFFSDIRKKLWQIKNWTIEKGELMIDIAGKGLTSIWEFLKELYPANLIEGFKARITEIYANKWGVVGQTADWILSFLFGFHLFGPEKAQNIVQPQNISNNSNTGNAKSNNSAWTTSSSSRSLPTAYGIGNGIGQGFKRLGEKSYELWAAAGAGTASWAVGLRDWLRWENNTKKQSTTLKTKTETQKTNSEVLYSEKAQRWYKKYNQVDGDGNKQGMDFFEAWAQSHTLQPNPEAYIHWVTFTYKWVTYERQGGPNAPLPPKKKVQ